MPYPHSGKYSHRKTMGEVYKQIDFLFSFIFKDASDFTEDGIRCVSSSLISLVHPCI